MNEPTPDLLRLMEKYTLEKRCAVSDEPEARTVWLKVGVQSFCLDGYQDTEEGADWMRMKLARALEQIVMEESKPK